MQQKEHTARQGAYVNASASQVAFVHWHDGPEAYIVIRTEMARDGRVWTDLVRGDAAIVEQFGAEWRPATMEDVAMLADNAKGCLGGIMKGMATPGFVKRALVATVASGIAEMIEGKPDVPDAVRLAATELTLAYAMLALEEAVADTAVASPSTQKAPIGFMAPASGMVS